MYRKNVWETYTDADLKTVESIAARYRYFMDHGKTERECVKQTIAAARAAGYVDLDEVIESGRKLESGDKVYASNCGKTIVLFQLGSEPMEKGMNILGAHIDSPRLDIKQCPLYEDAGLAYLDTHYYGGIKKYQWVTLPMALHGVVCKKDGSVQEITIGEDLEDPVVGITDLLIHLAADQMVKKANVVIEGEQLDVLVGSRPLKSEDGDKKKKDAVKKNILAILKDKYGIEEEDFISAEIEVVPAGPAREFGLDRSMIMAYGQDDKICAFTSLEAMLEVERPERTAVCLLVDKEEIGSVGVTGMQSKFFENTVAEVLATAGQYSDLALRRSLKNSCMISSDVSIAFDPQFASTADKKNIAYFGEGIVFHKYTGARGKSGSNDANPEYIAQLREIMDTEEIYWQTAELGKVDQGGGGTIAYISSLLGMQVIDAGVAVLCMHAPWEISSKADIYEAEKAYAAFLRKAKTVKY